MSLAKPFLMILLSLTSLATSPATTSAAILSFSFQDEVGDPRDGIDATGVNLTFDNQTGDFTVKVMADSAHPLDGRHLLYLSVFNPDVGSLARDVSFFNIVRFNIGTDGPATENSRSGVSQVLTHWKLGDRVASYDVLGLPDGVSGAFHSVLGGNTAGFSISDEILDTSVIVPESSTVTLLLTCCFFAAFLSVRMKRTELN